MFVLSAIHAVAFAVCPQIRTPLYDAEAFPRIITVYACSALSGPAFTASDYNPTTNKATVLAGGAAPLAAIRDQIAHVAAQVWPPASVRVLLSSCRTVLWGSC